MAQVSRPLHEARTIRAKKRTSATAFTWSARFLTFGQYIIGGVLASSFVQQKTSPQVIGVFGVLVLLASLITQHYHPELSAQTSSREAEQLGALIRESEDRIVVIEATMTGNKDDPQRLLELLEKVSRELKAITLLGLNTADGPVNPSPQTKKS